MEKYIVEKLLKEAKKAYKAGEVPVGALIEKNGKIISFAHNNRQKKCDVTGHAEVKAIIKAAKKQKDWRLNDYNLYVTLEPCDMCREIIKESRISNVYYLKSADKNNKSGSVCYTRIEENAEYDELFTNFFKKLR